MIFDNLVTIADRAPKSGLGQSGRFETYPALVERVSRLAAGFVARGIAPGDPVAVLLPNSPQLFVAAHALFAIGAIAMPLGLTATRTELAAAANKAGITAIVARADLVEVAQLLAADCGNADLPIFLDGGDDDNAIATLERAAPIALPTLSGTTTALYLFSSGSTGLPKIVPHTHAQLLSDGRAASGGWAITPDDRVIDLLPGNFALGFMLGAFDTPAGGGSTIYWSDPRPFVLARARLFETIATERATILPGVPAMFETLASARGDVDMSTLRLVFSGGAALKRPAYDGFHERFGHHIRQAYGSTEAIMISHNGADDLDRLWDSCGTPVGDARVKIAPPEPGVEFGELMVLSSSLMEGYLGDPGVNAASFADGWFLTGDLARIDADGNIFIKGRSKLLIEVSGFKIDPIEVEESLRLHPSVEEAVVVGVRDGRGGEQVLKAFIVKSADIAPDALIRFARERLSSQKVPTLIEFRDEIPKSPTGKILRGKLV